MAIHYVYTLTDLYAVVDHLDHFQVGDEIHCNGKISQNMSKAFNAYHKAQGGKAKAKLGVGAAFGALAFGPVGWLISASATASLLASSTQIKEAKKAYCSLPCAAEVEDLARAGFELVSNNGEWVTLSRIKIKV